MKTDLFQSCGHCWVFQIFWHIEYSTFTASSLRIWNSSTGISCLQITLVFFCHWPSSCQWYSHETGKFGLGVHNEAGQRLAEFCQENALVIANTLFREHKRRLSTWTSPDGQYWNQILLISLQPKMEKLYTVRKNKSGCWQTLWTCCTQYASKFGKLSSGRRTGKGQFSFQSQRKAMPKNAQTTAQLHSSHTLVK